MLHCSSDVTLRLTRDAVPSPLKLYCILTIFLHKGLFLGPKTLFIPPPPPSKNYIFCPSRDTSFFDFHRGLFPLILPYFTFILPFYFLFSNFLSPFFLFLFPFFLFLLHFPLFFSSPFHIFPPKWHRLIFFHPPRGAGGIFQYIDPVFTEYTVNRKLSVLLTSHNVLKGKNRHFPPV